MFKTFHQYLQTREGHTAPLDSPVSSCCLLPLITLITTPEIITNGGVITANATTGLELVLGSLVLLGFLVFFLKNKSLMSEIAQKPNSTDDIRASLANFIFGSGDKKEVIKQDLQNAKGFWSKYNLNFQNEFQEIRKLWLAGFDLETKQIKSFKQFDLGYQKLQVFLEKRWLELTEEDRQIFITSAQQILTMSELTEYTQANKSLWNVAKFFFNMSKIIGFKKIIALINDYISLGESQERKDELASVFQFNEHQSEYANKILELASIPSAKEREFEERIRLLAEAQPKLQYKDDRTPEEIEEQIRKNRKLAEHYRKKLTEKDERTPKEIEQDREDFEFLQEVIKKYR